MNPVHIHIHAGHGTTVDDAQMRFACIASGLSGVIFARSPSAGFGVAPDFDLVLAISALTAIAAIGLLRIVVPSLQRKAAQHLEDTHRRE